MIILTIFKLIILLHISESSDVTQTPSLWVSQGESAQMNCSHTKGADYWYMYWFRQRQGETMRLIAFTMINSDPDFGEFSQDKYSAEKTVADKGSFTDISESSDVTQTPILWVPQGKSAEMNCSHTKGQLYFYMYWFRQQQGETMKLIAFTMKGGKPDFGQPLKVVCSITGTDNPNLYWYRWTPTDGFKLMFSSLGVGMVDPASVGDFSSNRPGLLQIVLESKSVTEQQVCKRGRMDLENVLTTSCPTPPRCLQRADTTSCIQLQQPASVQQ
ncbi:hypothetical protein QQF64_011725 [Cirrhinus molitorella]|uniref:Immunoglobulin V-set domain-containing protein n=1 Tax=Cirrhinus molitorella TaxID=172907 RepID=A0ABR3M2J4_9TELE